jgi:hypothetical protein
MERAHLAVIEESKSSSSNRLIRRVIAPGESQSYLCGRKVRFLPGKFRHLEAKFSPLLYEQQSLVDLQI